MSDKRRAGLRIPEPDAEFHARVLNAYDAEFSRPSRLHIWLKSWHVFAVAAVAAGILIAFVIAPRETRLEPVHQPRFIIISQGEHP